MFDQSGDKRAIKFAGFADESIAEPIFQGRSGQRAVKDGHDQKPEPESASSAQKKKSSNQSFLIMVILGAIGYGVLGVLIENSADLDVGQPGVEQNQTTTRENSPAAVTPGIIERLVETAPPQDYNAKLSIEQTRYCLFWRARIERMGELAVHEPLFEPLQEYYDGYNSECVKRRLDPHYAHVQSELDIRLGQIEEEAAWIVNSWKPTHLAPVVRTIQADLNYLGYDAGPVDGLYGPKTRNALLSIQRAVGAAQDGRVTFEVRDLLHQMTTSLREQRGQAASAAESNSDEGPTRWFGLQHGASADDLRLVETNKVPLVLGQHFGWYIYVGGTEREVSWKEEYFVPKAPSSWGVEKNQPYIVVSEDGRLVTTRRSTVPNRGYISNFWMVGGGDPLGAHRIVVTVEGSRVEAFDFELVQP